MFRQVYIEDWFRDTRYGTLIFVYVAGDPSAFGGITKRFRLIVRIRSDGSLSSLSVVPSTVTVSDIHSWYGPAQALSLTEAKTGAWWADRQVLGFFPSVVYRSSSASLISFAYA